MPKLVFKNHSMNGVLCLINQQIDYQHIEQEIFRQFMKKNFKDSFSAVVTVESIEYFLEK